MPSAPVAVTCLHSRAMQLNPTEEDLKGLERIDWDTAFRNVNQWYNEMSAALRVKDRAASEKAFDKLEAKLVERKMAIGDAENVCPHPPTRTL